MKISLMGKWVQLRITLHKRLHFLRFSVAILIKFPMLFSYTFTETLIKLNNTKVYFSSNFMLWFLFSNKANSVDPNRFIHTPYMFKTPSLFL